LGVSSINNSAFEITTKTGDTAQIGDPTKPTFSPEIALSRWNGECKLKIAYDDSRFEPASKTVQYSSDEVRLNTPSVDFRFYEVDKGDAALEEEIIFKTKPASNKIVFTNQSENLIAYHQPPLTQEFNAEDCVELSETHALLKGGSECKRPVNVVSSIAFYHATRRNLHESGEEAEKYKSGKAFHLYRPECIDADGKRAWADFTLDADDNIVLTVPQEFLDSAKYPMVVDPTFGYTNVAETWWYYQNDKIVGCKFTLPENGEITNLNFYGYIGTYEGAYKMGIYNLDGSAFQDIEASGLGTGGGWKWYTLPVSNEPLAAGDYILCQWQATSLSYTVYDSGGTNQTLDQALAYGDWPASLSPDNYYDRVVSIYATYTPSATLQAVTDSLVLSEAVLRDKALTIADAVAAGDSVLGNKDPLIVAESLTLADLVSVVSGAIIKAVADTVNVFDAVFRHKPSLLVSDVIYAAEAVLAAKLLMVDDYVSLAEVAKVLKRLNVSDSLSLVDSASTPYRVLRTLEAIGATENAVINKVLQINETISLAEIVEVGVGGAKKTRLFLILGDLAVQLTGD
jgi:hypothetical protein